MTEHPIHCPICLGRWDFKTDLLGRLIAVHPVTKCVPAPPPVYAVDEPDDDLPERDCDECLKPFKIRPAFENQRVCSQHCRYVRIERLRAERKAQREREWVLTLDLDSSLPTVECDECGRKFSQQNRLGGKQIICSRACVRARNTRKARRRAA